jgi:hypothetical protein
MPPDCPLDAVTGCPTGGIPLYWNRSCVSFSLNAAASSQVDLATATQLAEEAFDTWNAVTCGTSGTPLSIHAKNAFGPVMCAQREFNPAEGNANTIIFRGGTWPYPGAGNTLALTTVSYDPTTGEINDADMEINDTYTLLLPGNHFVFEDAHDLKSIFTHEAGHFLGMAHTLDQNAVMQIELPPSTVRTKLDDDDTAGICTIYPPGRTAPACDYEPLNGFTTLCGMDPTTGGACSMARPSSTHTHGEWPWMSLAIGVPVLLRRRAKLRR